MKSLFIAFIIFIVSTPAFSQDFPKPPSPFVNDFADLIDSETEARITSELRRLREDRGTEMTVVTIESRATYGDTGTLESFSTALLNTWGIGNADKNDGILFLISRGDREIRVELGAGYAPVYDDRMKAVIDHTIIPFFRKGDFSAGAESGVLEIIKRTGADFVDPPIADPGPETSAPWQGKYPLLALLAFAISVIALRPLPAFLRDRLRGLSRCPNCGRRTLEVNRKRLFNPTADVNGTEERTVRCTNCSFVERTNRLLTKSRLRGSGSKTRGSSSGSGHFGGGRSGGGGASGRW